LGGLNGSCAKLWFSFLAAWLTVAIATLPAVATPVGAEAGLRAYFVITEPQQTGKVPARFASNGGTVYATYDAIGVIVAHSTATDFAAKMREVDGVQKAGRDPYLGPAGRRR
jgi:hypothetical protein